MLWTTEPDDRPINLVGMNLRISFIAKNLLKNDTIFLIALLESAWLVHSPYSCLELQPAMPYSRTACSADSAHGPEILGEPKVVIRSKIHCLSCRSWISENVFCEKHYYLILICSILKRRQNGREASILLKTIRMGKGSWGDREGKKCAGNKRVSKERVFFLQKKKASLQVIS